MHKAPRGAIFVIVALAVGCLMAGCGSASSSSSTTGSAGASSSSTTTSAATGAAGGTTARRTALVACLKSHGVTLPTRPAGAPPAGGTGTGTTGTGTGTGTTGTGGPPGGGFFGGGAGGGARRFANNPKLLAAFKACGANFGFRRGNFAGRISHTTITKYVACVRQHGYNLPTPNFSGKGPVFPSNIRTNPKFVSASKACQSILVPPRPSGGTSTNSGA